MNVETLARRVSRQTRDDVIGSLDLEARLRELHLTRVRRRRTRTVAALASACLVVALAGVFIPRWAVDDLAPAAPSVPQEPCPDHALVRCLDDSTVLVRGKTPYTFSIQRGFSRAMSVDAVPYSIDIFRTVGRGGVTILEGVHAAGGPKVHGAEALARWVGSRPFLQASPVRHGKLDGLDSWTVEVRLTRDASRRMPDACNGTQPVCRPVLEQPSRSGWQTGVWEKMATRYTFLDVPGLGTVAVWSWVFGGNGGFEQDAALVRSIDFLAPS